ncbi:MAG TPA: DUF1707 domain-containing protein [Streptosporangiaceae bacterium]|nr:DUF1707 domain-containing protein [Streptosporangiaceae bacterium]
MNTDTRPYPPGQLRVSDADRDRALSELSEHYQAGRLTAEELDDRSGRALRARTGSDLAVLLADLPPAPAAGPGPAPAAPAPAPAPGADLLPAGPRDRVPVVLIVVAVLAIAAAVTGLRGGLGGHGGALFPLPVLVVLLLVRLTARARSRPGPGRWPR